MPLKNTLGPVTLSSPTLPTIRSVSKAAAAASVMSTPSNGLPSSPLSPPPSSIAPSLAPSLHPTSSDLAHSLLLQTSPAQGSSLQSVFMPPVLATNLSTSASPSALLSPSSTSMDSFDINYFFHKNIAKDDQVKKLLFCFEGVAQQVWIAAKEVEFRNLTFEEFMAALHVK
ncbi:hypothetical protein C0995_005668 [Termitomyces sp. Mi166|nr:hypothetical protein C0995_005668 [Termitomyces sp. Mi166\